MERKLNKFFTSTIISALGNLKEDSKAEWGTMTPKQMLKHLIQSSKMMHLENTKLIVKEKNISRIWMIEKKANEPLNKRTKIACNIRAHNIKTILLFKYKYLKLNVVTLIVTLVVTARCLNH